MQINVKIVKYLNHTLTLTQLIINNFFILYTIISIVVRKLLYKVLIKNVLMDKWIKNVHFNVIFKYYYLCVYSLCHLNLILTDFFASNNSEVIKRHIDNLPDIISGQYKTDPLLKWR